MGDFNGSGSFIRSYSWETDRINGIKIRSDRMDTEDDGFATNGLTNCVTRDGQSPWTANLPAGGFKITNLAAGSARGDSVNAGQLVDGILNFAVASGSGTYTTAPSPAVAAYTDGQQFAVRFTNSNSAAAPTLNVSAVGAKTLVDTAGASIGSGIIPAGFEALCRYNSGADKIYILNLRVAWTLLAAASPAGASNFTAALGAGFKNYQLKIWNWVPSGTGQLPLLTLSTDGGSTYLSANYARQGSRIESGTQTLFNDTAQANIGLSFSAFGAAPNARLDINIANPGAGSITTMLDVTGNYVNNTPSLEIDRFSAYNTTTSAVTNAKVAIGSGTFTCSYELWGLP